MGYRKKFEDSYLDDEDEEFDGTDRTDGERVVALLEKPVRTPLEDARIKKLTERLFTGAKLPAIVGQQAVLGIEMVAGAYASLGQPETAVALWARLSDIAEIMGNRELYYRALDEMGQVG